jgi:hypothetical protein
MTTALLPPLGYTEWTPRLVRAAEGLTGRRLREPATANIAPQTLDPAQAAFEAHATLAKTRIFLGRVAYYDSGVARRAEAALLRMHRAIRARGGQMVLVVPPIPREARAEVSRIFRPDVIGFRAMADRLAADGVIVAWHWDDPAFDGRHALFRDTEHLSDAGAALFSRALGDELRGRGLLPPANCPAPRPSQASAVSDSLAPRPETGGEKRRGRGVR